MPSPSARSATVGFWTAVALVMGNMIGSGIFLLPSSLAPFGGFALLGWIVSAGGSIMLALVFARLAKFHSAAGGPYAFTRLAFGDLAGFLVAWGYWISIWCGNAAIAMAFVGALKPFAPNLVADPRSTAMLAAGAVWVLTAVNIWGITAAGRVQVWTTVVKILPLVLIGVAGFAPFHAAQFAFAAASPRAAAGSLAAAATLTFWAFGGLESATIPAESVRDPGRTIPRATMIGTLCCAVLYIICSAGVMNVIPPDVLKSSAAPFADAAARLFGTRAGAVVAAGSAIACFGALNGWILVAGQVAMAIARDGLFPRMFARVSRRGTPAISFLISSVLTTVLICMNASRGLVDVFTFVILLGTLSALVPYAFCSLAGLVIDRNRTSGVVSDLSASETTPEVLTTRPEPETRGTVMVAALAFAYAIWAIGGAGADVVYWGFLLLLAGLPVYVWMAGQRERRA